MHNNHKKLAVEEARVPWQGVYIRHTCLSCRPSMKCKVGDCSCAGLQCTCQVFPVPPLTQVEVDLIFVQAETACNACGPQGLSRRVLLLTFQSPAVAQLSFRLRAKRAERLPDRWTPLNAGSPWCRQVISMEHQVL